MHTLLKILGIWLLADVVIFMPLWIAVRGGLRDES